MLEESYLGLRALVGWEAVDGLVVGAGLSGLIRVGGEGLEEDSPFFAIYQPEKRELFTTVTGMISYRILGDVAVKISYNHGITPIYRMAVSSGPDPQELMLSMGFVQVAAVYQF